MKKSGFTLAEALISLAIIGIVAAIAAPMISRYKPDEDKVTFLRSYDAIVEIVKNVADNTRLYPLTGLDSNGNIVDYSDNPLENKVKIEDYKGTGVSYPSDTTKDKLCEILADSFKASPNRTCDSSKLKLEEVNFSTKEGIDFYMETRMSYLRNLGPGMIKKIPYKTTIKFDINGSEGPNCVYGASGCIKPDQFEVLVSSAGRVVASDVMAQKFLQTRGSWRKVDLDVTGLGKITELPGDFVPERICDDLSTYREECHNEFCDVNPEHEKCQTDPCEGYDPATDGYKKVCSSQYCDYWKEAKAGGVLYFSSNYLAHCINAIDKNLLGDKNGENKKNEDDDKKTDGVGGVNQWDQEEFIDSVQDQNGINAAEDGEQQPYYDPNKPDVGDTDGFKVK